MYRLIVTTLFVLVTCGSIQAQDATYWPGWLGKDRDGQVNGFQIPSDLPESLEQAWQVDVGTGYGTPLVIGQRVYQHARQQEDEVLWCLDLQSGEVQWKQSYPVPFKMGGGGERHGKGPKSNPFYHDGRLFTLSITGILSAWRAENGDLIWRKDYRDEFGTNHPYWGASTSPIVDGNRVIVHFGNDERGALIAHDVETGDVIWRQGNDGASYSSPLVTELDGVRQIVQWNHRAVVGVDCQTGEKLWDQPFEHEETNQNMPTPVVWRDSVLVGGENRGLYRFIPSRENGKWRVEERWFQDKVALDMSTPVVHEGLLLGFSHYGQGRLFCVDCESGDVLWQGPGRAGQNVTFLSLPDHVVALINDGTLKILSPSAQSLEEVKSYPVASSETWAAPVLLKDAALDNALLIKDTTKLTMWRFGSR